MADTNTKRVDQIPGAEIGLEAELEQPGIESISGSPEAQFETIVSEALLAGTETVQTAKSEAQDYVQYAQSQDIFPEELNEINKLNVDFGTTIDSWSQDFNKTINEVKEAEVQPEQSSENDPTAGVTAASLRERLGMPPNPTGEVSAEKAADPEVIDAEFTPVEGPAPVVERPEPESIDIPNMQPEAATETPRAEAPAAEASPTPAPEPATVEAPVPPVEAPEEYDLAPAPEKDKGTSVGSMPYEVVGDEPAPEAIPGPEPVKIDIPDMVPEEPAQPTGYTQEDLEDLAAAVRAHEQANPKRFKYKEWTMFSMIPSFMRKKDAWSHKLEIAYSTSKAKKWAEKLMTAQPGIEFSRAKTALQRLDDHRIEASLQLLKQISERLKPRYEKRKKLEAKAQFEVDEIQKYEAQIENYRGAVEQWGKYPDIMAQIRKEIQPRINAINKRKERLGAIRLKAQPLLKEIAEMEAQKKKYEKFTGPDRMEDIFAKLRRGPEKSS